MRAAAGFTTIVKMVSLSGFARVPCAPRDASMMPFTSGFLKVLSDYRLRRVFFTRARTGAALSILMAYTVHRAQIDRRENTCRPTSLHDAALRWLASAEAGRMQRTHGVERIAQRRRACAAGRRTTSTKSQETHTERAPR